MNNGWFLADVLHDVDLAAGWPAGRPYIVTEHPECGPHALSLSDFYARFETAILLLKQSSGFQARGSVLARNAIGTSEGFLVGGDDEVAILHVRVLGPIGIGLKLVVTPTVAAR